MTQQIKLGTPVTLRNGKAVWRVNDYLDGNTYRLSRQVFGARRISFRIAKADELTIVNF